tara:strand:- start:75 stop:296 length:222 start_codon:yes stop_codon:yes gene_type:complete
MMALKELIENLLDDDEGISSEAYSSLLSYLATINEMNLLEEINNRVKTANGRYYFPRGPEWQSIESWADCKKC